MMPDQEFYDRVQKQPNYQEVEQIRQAVQFEEVLRQGVPKKLKDGEEVEPSRGISFGHALNYLRRGRKVAREGWHGKGMWLKLQQADAESANTLPYIYIVGEYPEGHLLHPKQWRVPWVASQTDLLAEDWFVVE